MAKIIRKERLNPTVTRMDVEAPLIAKKAQPGQFVILRVDEKGERIPLTIADYDRAAGTVTIIFQKVGLTTELLDGLEAGDDILDFVGPLGTATEVEPDVKRVAVIGGGVGCAIAFPQAKALHARGVQVDVIAGFRSRDIVILEDEFKANCDRFYLTTDDGTYGEKGLVTDKLKSLIDGGASHEPHHDRRHRHVRRLPGERGGPGEIRLRGRSGLRRPPGGLRRADHPQRGLPGAGGRDEAEPSVPSPAVEGRGVRTWRT